MLEQKLENGFAQIEAGLLDEGQQTVEAVLSDEALSDDLRYEAAERYLHLGFVEEAARIVKNLAKRYPDELELQLFLAEAYIEQGLEDEALLILDRIGPAEGDEYIRAILLAAEIYLMQSLYEVAEHKIRQALKVAPEHQVLHTALGEVFYAQEKYSLAIASFERGSVISTYSKLADCYAHIGQFEKALELYKKAVTAEQEHVDLLFGYAFVAYQLEEWDTAIGKFQRLLELDPFYTSAYPLLLEALQKSGDLKGAKQYVQQGLKYDQTNPYLFWIQAEILLSEGKREEAIDALHNSLELDDSYQPALDQLYELYRSEQDWEQCLHYINRLLQVSPERAELLAEKGRVLEELEQWQEAIEAYRQALERDEQDTQTMNQLARLLRDEGELDQAIKLWRRSLQIDPQQWEVEQYLEQYEGEDFGI